jgi:hypothetical protein
MQNIKLFIALLIPFNSEHLLEIYQGNGNMALYGVHLEIYYKRNLFYISVITLPLFYLFKYTYFGLLFLLLSFFLFLRSCYKWKEILLINL